MEKVITATFQEGGGNTVTVYGLWQWDHGISLQIMGLSLPETVEVHFAIGQGEPVNQEGRTTDGITTVDIPDSMLAGPTGAGIFGCMGAFLVNAWVYVEDGTSGRTVKMVKLSVKTRAKPPDYIATPEEKKTWEQLQEGKADKLELVGRILSLMSGERLLSEVTLPAGGGTGTFYVSVTQDESGAVTADKTMAEIEAAYSGGQAVYCLFTSPVYNNMPCILPLFVHVTGTLYVFGGSGAMDANQPMYLTLICMADSWMVLGEKLVQSVNGKQGEVVLSASDVGAAESYIITLSSGSSGAVKCDRAYADIQAALRTGNAVAAVYGSDTYTVWMSTSGIVFQNVSPTTIGTTYAEQIKIIRWDSGSPNPIMVGRRMAVPMVESSYIGKVLIATENGYSFVELPSVDTPRKEKTSSDSAVSIQPGILYVFPEMESLSIALEAPENTGIVNEYHFIFRSGGTATTLTLPDSVNVPSGFSVEANKIYEISILEGCLTYQSWEVS